MKFWPIRNAIVEAPPGTKACRRQTGGLAALAAALAALFVLAYGSSRAHPVFGSLLASGSRSRRATPSGTRLQPGHSARFGGEPPAEATLVLVSASGKTQRWRWKGIWPILCSAPV
jgi:hypothetical protein